MAMRMAWSGRCEVCGTVYHLYASEEQSPEEQEQISREWPDEGDCMVKDCTGMLEWNGNDELRDIVNPRLL